MGQKLSNEKSELDVLLRDRNIKTFEIKTFEQ